MATTDILGRLRATGHAPPPASCPHAVDPGAFAPDRILVAARRLQEHTTIVTQGRRYRQTAGVTQMQLLMNLATGFPGSGAGLAYDNVDSRTYRRLATRACGEAVARRTWLFVWSSAVEQIAGSHVQFWARTATGWRAWWELYP